VRVSVVMATFNGAGFVAEQIGSILAQTRRPDEFVVADDGSHDETLEIVRRLLGAAPGIDVVVLPSGGGLGVAANFERGLRAATGDVIALSDQDDVWHPDRLSTALSAFDDAALLQHADAIIVDEAGRPAGYRLFEALAVGAGELEEVAAGGAFALYLRRNLATGAATILRAGLRDLALPVPPGWIHDEWLAMIAAAFGGVQILDRPVIDYRQHGSNQIGVVERTLGHRLRRVVQPRAGRYQRLAARGRELEDRLRALAVDPQVVEAAHLKRRFEEARARYPRMRLARIPAVLREWRAGRYAAFSSQRDLDVVRDLLQSARSEARPERDRGN
jgi:glycosyltransferase involved in cell wall biosynthesis